MEPGWQGGCQTTETGCGGGGDYQEEELAMEIKKSFCFEVWLILILGGMARGEQLSFCQTSSCQSCYIVDMSIKFGGQHLMLEV